MAGHIKVCDPFDPATTLGPVISEPAIERILGMVERGIGGGARIDTGGERLGGDHRDGYFLPVTILADVANECEIAQSEVFGPVLVVTPFDSEDEAVALDEWNRILAVNLTGAMLCSQAVIPALRARGGGRIVNQTSGGAFPAQGIYGIGKLALVGLTTTLAKQLGREAITCNAIAPGNVATDAGKQLVPDDSPFLQFLAATCATRPRGEPHELVGALLLLCSEAGAWITGQTIHIDGGWVMRP